MAILVLGGAGYIGSHTVHELIEAGRDVVVADNLLTGFRAAVHPKARFYQADIRDRAAMDKLFETEHIDGVIHFAASSQVGESMKDPLKYYDNNLCGTTTLLRSMVAHGVDKIVFSSTAATYGIPEKMPIREDDPQKPINPYGESKLMMEKITNADMLVFNRCTPELKEALRARNLRMVNRRADIYLEDNDGNSEDYLTGDECPFDMTPDLIDIPDDDYGVWYVDAMDHPDRWDGKKVHMKLIMCHSKKFPGIHCPGRFVMTCCENDIQFVGIVAKGDSLKAYKNRDWVDITATVKKEHLDAYEGEGPVLYVEHITTTSKPAQEVVSF